VTIRTAAWVLLVLGLLFVIWGSVDLAGDVTFSAASTLWAGICVAVACGFIVWGERKS
jgi:hypothetical protein